jgi:hypothetical protein
MATTSESSYDLTRHGHSQILDRLSKHDILLFDYGDVFSDLQRGSSQTAMSLQSPLDKADSGQLDPRFIYLTVPRLNLNPLHYWHNVDKLSSNQAVIISNVDCYRLPEILRTA